MASRFPFLTVLTLVVFSVLLSTPAGARPAKHAPASSHALKTLSTQQIAKLALRSVVEIIIRDQSGEPAAQGSGFVIGPNLIATNVHVIKDAHTVTADFSNGRSEVVYGVVKMDSKRDLAILYANTAGIPALELAPDGSAQIGDPVVAVGSPEGIGWSISTGIVSGIHTIDSARIIQTTAPISHGSSGGALIDAHGRVLGVTSFYLRDGQNLNFAYGSTHLKALMPKSLPTYTSWSDLAAASPSTVTDHPLRTSTHPVPADSSAPFTTKPLTMLPGVFVSEPTLDDNGKSEGLDGATLKTDMELRLRKAGIRVFDTLRDPDNKSLASADLSVTTLLTSDGRSYVWTFSLEITEVVKLTRTTPMVSSGAVWRSSHFGIAPKGTLGDYVRGIVGNATDEFLNDFLAANPKP